MSTAPQSVPPGKAASRKKPASSKAAEPPKVEAAKAAPQAEAPTPPRPEEWPAIMAGIAERSQRLIGDFMARNPNAPSAMGMGMGDGAHVANAFMEMTAQMLKNPAKMLDAQMTLWRDSMNLWHNTLMRAMTGQTASPVAEPEKSDRRFKHQDWNENHVFDFIKQSYLLTSRWLRSTVADVEGLDDDTRRKVDFYTKQYVDAMAPTNFAITNPEVLRATVDTKGENLVKGLENLLGDLEKGKGKLRISMTDEKAFKVGENVAATPGKVVFQNAMIQLIQYSPTTAEVKETPIVIVPPWINKFYILDLRPANSLVKWLTDQGYTTFMVSWVNPDEKLADKTFENYMTEGLLAAKDAALAACNTKKVNMVGYCIGGTLLAGSLANLKAKGDESVATATYFVALTDFKDVGDIRVFIDKEQVDALEKRMADAGGYLDAADMATSFNMLRSNDLIWSFVVNNYLLGKEPFPFDLLYWNSDSTRMPKAMHTYYLRNMYLENNLAKPCALNWGGVPIDLRTVTTPTYMISCKEDHIAPWASTFEGTHLFQGPVRFVLSASGHIAGIVNPPAANKYCYWTNDKKAKTADEWFKGAEEHPGSWWTDWEAWLKPQSGGMVKARVPGDAKLKVIEAAPGSYVKVKAS